MTKEWPKVPFENIHVGERFRKDYGDIRGLIISIRLNGLLQPIVVKELGKDKYELLAGGRRMRALEEVTLYKEGGVPAVILPSATTEYSSRVVELVENIHRQQLSPMEEIHLKAEINRLQMQQLGRKTKNNPDGWSQAETAKMFGETPANMAEDLQLSEMASLIPELNSAKTKAEAKKILNETIKGYKRGKAIKEFQNNKATKGSVEKHLIDAYVIGNFLDYAPKLKANSFDLIEIDPPFAIDLSRAKKFENYSSPLNATRTYTDVTPEEYPAFMKRVLSESFRLAKKDAHLILWFAPEPWFEPMFQWMIEAGWQSRRMPLIWYKRAGQTKRPELHLGNAYEMAFYAYKGNAKLNKARNSVYDYASVPNKEHATEKPVELYNDLLYTFVSEGNNILVPFAGSGNALLAAANIQCTVIGYDLAEEHKAAYTEEIINQPYASFSSYFKEKEA
jgi:ParB/RepB/Spo0J family partition protein